MKFGCLAWGGPAAQISMISKECVDEERWVSPETFKKTLAVYQVLPGPETTELCVYFGRLRHGRLGGLVAGLGFMLPGLLLMLAFSALYVEAGLDESFAELFYGLKAAVGALVAIAVVRLGRRFIDDVPLAVIALAAFGLTIGLDLSFVLVLLGAGLAYELWQRAGTRPAALLSVGLLPLAVGLEVGLLTFGGAYTAVPFLHDSAVGGHEWLTEDEFLDGIALAGILPAPLVIFSTFVGYQAGGLDASLLMTLGVFLPAFAFPIFLHRQLVAVAENPHIRPFLLGVAAGVIGLIAAVTVDIVESSVVDVPSGILAVVAFLALYRYQAKLTVLYVVLGCGIAGALWQLTV